MSSPKTLLAPGHHESAFAEFIQRNVPFPASHHFHAAVPGFKHPGEASQWLARLIFAHERFGLAVYDARVKQVHCELFVPYWTVGINEGTYWLTDDLHYGQASACDLSALLLRVLSPFGMRALGGDRIEDDIQSFGNPGMPSALEAMASLIGIHVGDDDIEALAYLLSDMRPHVRKEWCVKPGGSTLLDAFLKMAEAIRRES